MQNIPKVLVPSAAVGRQRLWEMELRRKDTVAFCFVL